MVPRIACLALAVTTAVAGAGQPLTEPPGPQHELAEPLCYCVGLQGPGAAEVAARMGLNAVAYRLPVDTASRLEDLREELAEVTAAGLKIILQLPTNLGYEQPQIRLGSREYWGRLESYVAAVVPALKDTAGLVAWQTDDFPERTVQFDANELRQFLSNRYGSLEGVNRAWGSEFTAWERIDRAAALGADEKAPWGVGPASVDVAQWQVLTVLGVLERWAAAVRRLDPDHMLMTGRLSLYRTLASVPPGYDVAVPAIRPDVLEDDPLAADVHAVDMARRAGRFGVIPSLYVPLPPSPLYRDGTLRNWVLEAAAHGARGFALDGWERIATVKPMGADEPVPLEPERVLERATIIGQTVGDLVNRQVFGVRPRPSYAFLWTPYAGGLEVLQVPAYGYIEGWSPVEPGGLFFSFRRGCAWGPADYLTVEDVPLTNLDQYGAILAPQVLDLPEPTQQALADWVSGGGVLVADAGLGMKETGSWLRLPDALTPVFGMSRFELGQVLMGGWQVTRGHELLPDLKSGARAVGSMDPKQPQTAPATQRRPQAIKGWAAYAKPASVVTTVAVADTRADPREQGRVLAGIFAHSRGAGGGVFASFRLWERWEPADPLFAAFHGSLCARRGKYVLGAGAARTAGGFWPGAVSVVPEADGVALVARASGVVELAAVEVDDALYSGAYCQASAASRLSDGRRSGDVSLMVETVAGSLLRLRRQGVAVRPYEGTCLSRLEACGPRAVQVMIYGGDAVLQQSREGLVVHSAAPTLVRVLVSDGEYEVKPGSAHRVTVTSRRGAERSFEVRADAGGHLDFDVSAQQTGVLIEPAGAEAPGQ